MAEDGMILVTDAAPSVNSSTSREVADFVQECNKGKCPIVLVHPAQKTSDKYVGVDYSITCRPVFYKSSNLYLRLLSELFISLSLVVKVVFTSKKILRSKKIVYISPSIFNLLPSLVLRKKSKSGIYLMLRDMFPYWLVDADLLKEQSVYFKLFKKVADFQMRACDVIGVESGKSLEFFLEKYPECINKTEILRNWITTKEIQNDGRYEKSQIRLIYAGSIGEAQGVDNFTALLMHWKERTDVEIHISGRGSQIRYLVNFADENDIGNFYVHEQVESAKFDDFLRQYDVGLFFLRHDLHASNIPGKFMSYVMNGLPVLGAVNPENELVTFVTENNLGYLDWSGANENFIDCADRMVLDFIDNKFSKKTIQKCSSEHFSTAKAFEQISRARCNK